MKKPNYNNSIENNKRNKFKANIKKHFKAKLEQMFKENLKMVPKFVAIYLVCNSAAQYIFKSEIDSDSLLTGAAMFAVLALLGSFSTNHKRNNN